MKRFVAYPASIVLLLGFAVVLSTAAEKTFEKKFTVALGGTLTIETDVGDVEISGTSSNEVSIVAEIHGRERDVEGFDISASQGSDGVLVKGRSRRSSWLSWFGDGPKVRFKVMVPREYSAQVHTSGGNRRTR